MLKFGTKNSLALAELQLRIPMQAPGTRIFMIESNVLTADQFKCFLFQYRVAQRTLNHSDPNSDQRELRFWFNQTETWFNSKIDQQLLIIQQFYSENIKFFFWATFWTGSDQVPFFLFDLCISNASGLERCRVFCICRMSGLQCYYIDLYVLITDMRKVHVMNLRCSMKHTI